MIVTNPDGQSATSPTTFAYTAVTTTTPAITEFPPRRRAAAPHGITAGPDGNLWFAEYTGNKIGQVTLGGTVTEHADPHG